MEESVEQPVNASAELAASHAQVLAYRERYGVR